MSSPDRRAFLLAAAALLPALASRDALAQSAAIDGTRAIEPPPQPMIYTRRLVRGLTGNARIMVERRFAVRFTRSASGFVVEGEQIGVDVEIPEQLAWLGKLERERVESGIFPLQLDNRGRILSGETVWGVPEIEAALREVETRVEQMDATADQREALQEFVTAIHEAGTHIVSTLPSDLFAPDETDRRASRGIVLPHGAEGEVSTLFSAQRDPLTGLMRSARREVVTAIAGDQRHTVETFSLVPQLPEQAEGISLPLRRGA